ncbi:hypothetical protein GOB94_06865 [Granulicella sp. 5B5]|uniref:hypothetical protein n=1 Tax=Granulicella sp. 5B5 TaxID=1617967 RepID=UPI0015F528B5|nr:hypothetical protein [Granulicella sp. 5B5]QMV18436.1 hypothetical protein GOB94_06865 [Granulicella sp. 5B5]
MTFLRIATLIMVAASACPAQSHATSATAAQLPAHATLPISFTKTVSASHSRPGDTIQARTTQAIHLVDGRVVPAGTLVTGHILAAKAFAYDETPYAKQVPGVLEIQFDSLQVQGQSIPLHVSLRAMADPLTGWHAADPPPSDMDPLGTLTQVGGDQLVPSQKEIRDRNGDVVGYNKKGGAYAHLIANVRGPVNCDAGDTEQPMSQFSASACGLYGFTNMSLTSFDDSHIGLVSTHSTPQIWKHSIALLETMPDASSK